MKAWPEKAKKKIVNCIERILLAASGSEARQAEREAMQVIAWAKKRAEKERLRLAVRKFMEEHGAKDFK